ncbi:hypothetical protein LEP1GSC191_0160 [Leptospira borgpetersenii serovar Mini str. 201000851]|uniref:Uncharacterized protein n=3 Tax=Leptospira borgpetersenii TaxID=174 RepID=M3H3K2_LEPBO|nr:hypothetical protein LBBP_01003 [Leptospira borgpetersenii serovar Ballum]EKP13819.1 hypothetical protein LEP1GSC128_0725 [Leptospira borgpetersenii str. 200801926]EKQ98643.1 hypothetical protein LEP1GSC121_3277 [Leptospira borgpetersenii serovar Castellonis str. 200801910]EMG01669.1 hypothetical protein LEP1GSC123_3516 [Leptospira borgpetersenii str. 200701203]EMK09112.1 hypothetical protein LEP1GSC066_0202 [Leptospira sp. serovar Kenya str. Sh9]ENO63759.1 hypothetical protein LEP1GSC191_0
MDRILKNQVIDLPVDIENASQRKRVSTFQIFGYCSLRKVLCRSRLRFFLNRRPTEIRIILPNFHRFHQSIALSKAEKKNMLCEK